LNEIIEIIQRKDNKDSLNKEEILHQIKGLLAKSYQEKAAK
jgi:thymidine phosphorylase